MQQMVVRQIAWLEHILLHRLVDQWPIALTHTAPQAVEWCAKVYDLRLARFQFPIIDVDALPNAMIIGQRAGLVGFHGWTVTVVMALIFSPFVSAPEPCRLHSHTFFAFIISCSLSGLSYERGRCDPQNGQNSI